MYDLTKIDMILRENVLFTERMYYRPRKCIFKEKMYNLTRNFMIYRDN